MVDHALLLKDLQKQVRLLETDLRERSEDPTAIKGISSEGQPETFDAALKREYQRARDAERTATTEGAWREGQVTQAAVAWVLATVFARFCEDNELLEQPFISGPKDEHDRYNIAQELKDAWVLQGRSENPGAPELTDRDWLEHAFEQMSVSSVMAGLFDKKHNPMWSITPSHQAAKTLIDFWRSVGEDGHLVHDFTDTEWNTRFLGDLYQDLSETTRKSYALLQTPEFIEEFILDYTLEPAVEEFGLDGNRVYQTEDKGFRLIDPTCGSGHFLLGAFHRLLAKWREAEPGASDWDLINRSLRSVHGVDKNPFAVSIARFRLLVAAMREAGITRLGAGNPNWPIIVAAGDSLLHGRGAPGVQEELFPREEKVHRYSAEDFYEYASENDLLGIASYHAVVGNPPYITVKDKWENQNYRNAYATCSGAYALSVPFAERFFGLARRGRVGGAGAGFVGQITANSFMKREFGKKLIEEFFRDEVKLTHVIDTSGAYIPGHGTPTVILIGRNEKNSHKSSIRAILGIRGEPRQPEVPAEGFVWSAIVKQIRSVGESESEWVSSESVSWSSFKSHPWSLSGGGASKLNSLLRGPNFNPLSSVCEEIGFGAVTREDSAYMVGAGTLKRHGVEEIYTRPLVEGEVLRDWVVEDPIVSCWPYDAGNLQSIFSGGVVRFLFPYRTILRERSAYGKTQIERGLAWYEYSMFFSNRYRLPRSIAFAFVATHNHFVLDRGGKVFNRSAPVIKLPKDATEEQHLELLGVLSSSTACFWLKQVSHDKGSQSGTGGFMHDEWEVFYEFTGAKIKNFPLPGNLPLARSQELDSLAQTLSALEPSAVAETGTPTADRLKAAHTEYTATRQRMITLQEELDWDVYHRYGLITDAQLAELIIPGTTDVPSISLGERAFEIVLARKVAAGETTSVWFSRHGSTPLTRLPSHWPEAYRNVVAKRIELIESDKNIGLIERPEFKRRWQSEPWEKKQKAALKSWLLDKCEDRSLWFTIDDNGDERARPLSVRGLANRVRDLFPEATEVAALYDPAQDFAQVIAEIAATEHVPYLAALRYKDSGLRKRADWEHVWDLQRQEDALNADLEEGEKEKRLDIPVPPKYTSADFLKTTYWSNRGKLDVPKERFVSYPGAEGESDPTLLLGWAGWDHAQQADALATLAHERLEQDGWGEQPELMKPLLAGIVELMPWVKQWHNETDEYGDTPADHVEEDLTALRNSTGITDSQMQEWRPAPPTRGRRKKA